MRRTLRLSAFIVFACLDVVKAQSTVYILTRETELQLCAATNTCKPGQLLAIDPEARKLISQEAITHTRFSIDSYVTPDGRYLLWAGADTVGQFAVMAFDPVTRSTRMVAPLPSSADRLFGHPSHHEVFLSTAPNPIAITPQGVQTVASPCQLPHLISMSGNGRQMVLACSSFSSPPTPIPLSIIDQETGALVALYPDVFGDLALNDAGSELYTLGDANSPWTLRRHQVATHMIVNQREIAATVHPPPAFRLDPRTGRLFLDRPLGDIEVVDPLTLENLGTVSPPENSLHWIAFDPSRPRAYVLSTVYGSSMPTSTRLDVIDTDSLEVIDGADLPLDTFPNAIVVAPRPAPPVDLSVTVENRRVTLSWSAGDSRAISTSYRLEAGSASGAADLAKVDVGLNTSFVAAPVPPGRYFVRVRAANFGGSSETSTEIVVDVPDVAAAGRSNRL